MKADTNFSEGCGIPAEARKTLTQIETDRAAYKRKLIISFIILAIAMIMVLIALKLDFKFMKNQLPFIFAGIGYTLLVSFMAISLACFLAIVGALGRLSKNPVFNSIASSYVSLIRGTPLLVQVYMWYLALPQIGKALEGYGFTGIQAFFTLPALTAGILALGVCYGAYMTETVRAGIQSIDPGQTEAANALGMTRSQTMKRIIFPQALRVIIPPVSNEFIAMVKDSSLVSLMGVWELSYRAIKMGRRHFQSLEMLITVALIYWMMCIMLQYFQEKLETHMARGDRSIR